MADRQEKRIWVETYEADGAVTKNGFVIRSTTAHTCKVPTGTGQQVLGVALDDAADGEEVAVGIIGRYFVIDKAGSLNNGDLVTTAGSANFHMAVIAATGNLTAGVVDGTDAASASDLVLVRIGAGYGHDAA